MLYHLERKPLIKRILGHCVKFTVILILGIALQLLLPVLLPLLLHVSRASPLEPQQQSTKPSRRGPTTIRGVAANTK
eukprot:scaffold43930_cov34-Prasinocladus_malaysianus.AAC.2